MSRARTTWKILAALLIALAAGAGAVALWVEAVASRRWTRLQEQVRQLHDEAAARKPPRPALRDEASPGNAWQDYGPALQLISGIQKDIEAINAYWAERPKADPERIRALIQAQGAVFDHLRRGTQRKDGAFPYVWSDGLRRESPGFKGSCSALGRLAACRARLLGAEGKPLEGARLMMDLYRYAGDLGANSDAQAYSLCLRLHEAAFMELKDLLFSPALTPADLSALGRELELIDRFFPPLAPALINTLMATGFELLKPDGQRSGELDVDARTSWRAGFSRKIVGAEAFDQVLAALRLLEASEGTAPRDRKEQGRLLEEERRRRPNPLAEFLLEELASLVGDSPLSRTQVRLLRMAAHYRATGDVLDLDDPSGGKLHHSLQEGRLKVWSVGRDGVDDGGHDAGLGWPRKPPADPGRYPRAAKDVVFTIDR